MHEAQYIPLSSNEGSHPHLGARNRRCHSSPLWKYPFVLLGVLFYIYPFIYTFQHMYHEHSPEDYALTRPLQTTWKRFWWNTKYSPHNHTESDDLWNMINPAHGFVAMDRQWAAENHWPVSMYLPQDNTKGVYLLEAYHQLHCLRIIRQSFWEALEHRPLTYPAKHAGHCFDTLRQSVQCNADNTPLFTFGDFTAGDGQLHRCRDWGELRDFATKHTACYRDSVENIPLGEHFGFCDDGTDGLEEAF